MFMQNLSLSHNFLCDTRCQVKPDKMNSSEILSDLHESEVNTSKTGVPRSITITTNCEDCCALKSPFSESSSIDSSTLFIFDDGSAWSSPTQPRQNNVILPTARSRQHIVTMNGDIESESQENLFLVCGDSLNETTICAQLKHALHGTVAPRCFEDTIRTTRALHQRTIPIESPRKMVSPTMLAAHTDEPFRDTSWRIQNENSNRGMHQRTGAPC
eukprot:Nitzschia sp. Nitz4//scaffold159_size51929//30969//31683//NITZ4_006880-RA/size51929-snap-gene-0.39-mRNA-1//1//CDS//3329537577//5547//frame0